MSTPTLRTEPVEVWSMLIIADQKIYFSGKCDEKFGHYLAKARPPNSHHNYAQSLKMSTIGQNARWVVALNMA